MGGGDQLYTAIREEGSSQGATGEVAATRKICMHCPLLLYPPPPPKRHAALARPTCPAKAGNA